MRKFISIIAAIMIFIGSMETFAQTYYPRPYIVPFYYTMQSGAPGFDDGALYYRIWHASTKSAKVMALSKCPERVLNTNAVYKQIAASDTLDSITKRRAIEYEIINLSDRSTQMGQFFGVERDRLEKALKTFENNINMLQTTAYGGNENQKTREAWMLRHDAISQSINIVSTYRMKVIDRKKCYINLYNDVLKYNKSLCDLLTYLKAAHAVSSFKPSSFTKVDKKSFTEYAKGRWKLAYYESVGK